MSRWKPSDITFSANLFIRRASQPLMQRRDKTMILVVGLISLAISASIWGQEAPAHKQNVRPATSTVNAAPAAGVSSSARFSYEFSQPQFFLSRILIEHDASGRGKVTFERRNEETPIVEELQISAAAWGRITSLWQALRFLDSETNYQSDKQFPHLGTMKLTMVEGERKRTAEFNWSNVKEAADLANEYRRIGEQANFVFDISVARENQPLNAPKLMESFESMLKRNGLSDPHQLIPLLKEISSDERLPLIARNHALRLLAKIK